MMKLNPFPGYEDHVNAGFIDFNPSATEEDRAWLRGKQKEWLFTYELPEGMTREDMQIDGPDEGQKMTLRVYRPAGLPENSPVILEVHGGGFVGGSLDIDDRRCIFFAQHTPCVVIGVDYRRASKDVHYPKPLEDVLCAWKYVEEHAAELGVDPKRMAMHGTSAGANLIAGASLYLRDHGLSMPALTVLNCPPLYDFNLPSADQLGFGPGVDNLCYTEKVDHIYYDVRDGQNPPYYAFPLYCQNVQGLNPHYIVVAEYDPLRDHGLQYADRLLKAHVPCELVLAGRVDHGFCVVDAPYTAYVQQGCVLALQREFGMLKD